MKNRKWLIGSVLLGIIVVALLAANVIVFLSGQELISLGTTEQTNVVKEESNADTDATDATDTGVLPTQGEPANYEEQVPLSDKNIIFDGTLTEEGLAAQEEAKN